MKWKEEFFPAEGPLAPVNHQLLSQDWRIPPKGDQPWVFFGRNDAKAETPILWPPRMKSLLFGKDSDAGRDWGQEEKGMTDDKMAGWHHQLDARDFE